MHKKSFSADVLNFQGFWHTKKQSINFLKEEDKATYLLCAEVADPNHLMRQVKLRSLKMYDSNGYTL